MNYPPPAPFAPPAPLPELPQSLPFVIPSAPAGLIYPTCANGCAKFLSGAYTVGCLGKCALQSEAEQRQGTVFAYPMEGDEGFDPNDPSTHVATLVSDDEPALEPGEPLPESEAYNAISSCAWEVIPNSPTGVPVRLNDLFSIKSPCTCGLHATDGTLLVEGNFEGVPSLPDPLAPLFTAGQLNVSPVGVPPVVSFPGPLPPVPAPVAVVAPVEPVTRKGPPINVRAKGQRGEREVVKLVQALIDRVCAKYPHVPAVTMQRNQLQSHMGGDDLAGLSWAAIEVKWQETLSVNAWWRQTVEQAERKNDAVPILFYRQSRSPWTIKVRVFVEPPIEGGDSVDMDVTISADDFAEWFCGAIEQRIKLGLPL